MTTPTSLLLRLPDDLRGLLASFLGMYDLSALERTCQALYRGRQVLYRSKAIASGDIDDAEQVVKEIKALQKINCRNAALLAQRCSVRVHQKYAGVVDVSRSLCLGCVPWAARCEDCGRARRATPLYPRAARSKVPDGCSWPCGCWRRDCWALVCAYGCIFTCAQCGVRGSNGRCFYKVRSHKKEYPNRAQRRAEVETCTSPSSVTRGE